MDPHTSIGQLPTSLLDLLCNPIIADNVLQYLPLSSIIRLSRTAQPYRRWVLRTPKVFRYLDLSRARGAYVPFIAPIDNGGHSWRAERMDENLTEDEFYAGPLRSVLNKLTRLHILQDVQVLVLDRLASVTHELLHEITTDSKYDVRLLSIRQCPNVNETRLRQLLSYLCRPSRPEGTPHLQGLYFFTDPISDRDSETKTIAHDGITTVDGAALGLIPSDKAQDAAAQHWYAPAGRVTQFGADGRSAWEETLQTCSGIIAFDAVLCKAMHEHMAPCLHEASREFLATSKPGVPTIATIALGPGGCAGCGKPPEGTPVWGESDIRNFPLLSPPPHSAKLIDAVRPPRAAITNSPHSQRLIVSCKWCLVNRHCDSCHRWWCADCYNPKQSNKLRDLEALSNAGLSYLPSAEELETGSASDGSKGDSIKVFNGFCVENCLVGEMMAGAGSNGMWA
ncbi:hypothetical protein OHC33_001441 [Knufia fluminis]|uniref:F-box domain-containing protein n=1 Tax=Knufia fluminis TaxID=191047 RepID=A0AAN8ERK8_9EURO|nr:hypothetical protein OHC33_001441 [Knufia fluminis]